MTKFIIDIYDKHLSSDRAAARYTFFFHDQYWAIKEYEYIDGKLMRPIGMFEREDINEQFQLYDSYEKAMEFVIQVKGKVRENE